jgi:hypothetical protein
MIQKKKEKLARSSDETSESDYPKMGFTDPDSLSASV